MALAFLLPSATPLFNRILTYDGGNTVPECGSQKESTHRDKLAAIFDL